MPINTELAIKEGTVSVAVTAFFEQPNLSGVVFPNSFSGLPQKLFEGCTGLKTVKLPESITEIPAYAFCKCKSLKKIDIPDSVRKIERSAFERCTALENITLGDNINSIGEDAFYKSGLNTITGVSGSYAQNYAVKNHFLFIEKSEIKEDISKVKNDNPIKVSVKVKTVKLKKLKKKAQIVKAVSVKNAKGKVSFKITKAAKIKKYLKINAKGVITFNKWKKVKKGTYKVNMQITAKGNSKYNPKTVNKVIKIRIK